MLRFYAYAHQSGVSKEEFANWFRKNGLVMTEEQCGVIMADFDAAGDGRLDYGEFTKFIGSFSAGGAPGGGRAAWEMPSRDDREAFGAAGELLECVGREGLLGHDTAVKHCVLEAALGLFEDAEGRPLELGQLEGSDVERVVNACVEANAFWAVVERKRSCFWKNSRLRRLKGEGKANEIVVFESLW